MAQRFSAAVIAILGIEARKQKEKAFFELAERFRSANDPEEAKQLGDQLGRLVFGE